MATIIKAVGREAFIEFNIPKARQSEFLDFIRFNGSSSAKSMAVINKEPYFSAPLVQLYAQFGNTQKFIDAVTIDETNFLTR